MIEKFIDRKEWSVALLVIPYDNIMNGIHCGISVLQSVSIVQVMRVVFYSIVQVMRVLYTAKTSLMYYKHCHVVHL
jgi:hypothetical protein